MKTTTGTKEIEKYECHDCGVYYWVIDRDNFECPNCEQIDKLKINYKNNKK